MSRTPITRRQYTSRMAALTADLLAAQTERDALILAYEDALSRSGHEPYPPECALLGERINAQHDRIDDLERALRDLDDEWETRHWTTQDWAEWELITRNID